MTGQPIPTPPFLIVCMGVSGCGKSTLAALLAERFNCSFLEADDFHSDDNKAHMASGKPLTDAMREPWIQSLCDYLIQMHNRGKSAVIAYSGLRRAHRQRFRQLGYPTLYLHLTGPKELVHQRMSARAGHFAPIELLDSQYDALEPIENEPDVTAIDLSKDAIAIADDAEKIIRAFILELSRTHNL